MKNRELIDLLFEKSNPIIRFRIAMEFQEEEMQYDIGMLRSQLLKQEDATYWMKCLKTRRKYDNIHGSYDKSLENSLGKLIQFGIKKGMLFTSFFVIFLVLEIRHYLVPISYSLLLLLVPYRYIKILVNVHHFQKLSYNHIL